LRFNFDTVHDAHAAGVDLLRSQLQPGSFLVSNVDSWTLTVRLDAPDNAIDRLVERVAELVSSGTRPRDREVTNVGSDASRPFTEVVDLTEDRAVARLPITASRQADALRMLASSGCAVCGDMGSGLVYAAGEAGARWQSAVFSCGVSPTLLSMSSHMKPGLDVFGATAPPVQGVVRRLKAAFDPHGRFNRGRFVLGL
jgi:hypothetical protein